MNELTRDEIGRRLVNKCGLSDWDAEDAGELIDVLLERFNIAESWSWLLFTCAELGGTPIVLIQQGRLRDVLAHARAMVVNG